MSLYIAAYDISDDGARGQVADVLLTYGRRVQRSVFQVWLEPEEMPDLRRQIGPLLAAADEFALFPVDQNPHRTRLQWQRPPEEWEAVVLM